MREETKLPKVSIGFPVYNADRYLRTVIENHLSQTFEDFELIIADNASTDATQAISEEFARRDPRVKYYRAETNMGAMWNFNRAFHLACGEYFKWSAHDDLMAPTFLERCVEVLDAQPDVILCHSLTKVVDLAPLDHGECAPERLPALASFDLRALATGDGRATTRFGARMSARHTFEIFGVIRSSAIAQVNRVGRPPLRPGDDPDAAAPYHPFVGADRAVLAELAVAGKFACVPEYLFYNGEHTDRSSAVGKDPLKRLEFYRPVKKKTRSFPVWSLFGTYLEITHRRFPTRGERLRCYRHIYSALFTRMNILRMMVELVNAPLPRLAPLMTRSLNAIRAKFSLTDWRGQPSQIPFTR